MKCIKIRQIFFVSELVALFLPLLTPLLPLRTPFLNLSGVAGGSIVQGVLRVGDEIEVRPGIVTKDHEGNVRVSVIFSSRFRVVRLLRTWYLS